MTRYSKEFIEFVRHNQIMANQDLIDLAKVKFPQYDLNKSRIQNLRHRYHLLSGLKLNTFKKGHEPHNKGKKMTKDQYEKCKGTMFQRGDTPLNERPLGSETIRKDGYLLVKVSMTGKRHEKWRPKHQVVWEEYYQRSIPKGSIIIFLDGNKRNFNVENLALIDRATHVQLNKESLRFDDQELTKTGINIVKLKIAIKDKE